MKTFLMAAGMVLVLAGDSWAAGKGEQEAGVGDRAKVAAGCAGKLRSDLSYFRLRLSYYGCGIFPGIDLRRTSPETHYYWPRCWGVVIDEKQAQRIVDWLQRDAVFFEHAVQGKAVAGRASEPEKPRYVLLVVGKETVFEDDLGWGPEMYERLQALRSVLDGDAAKAMDSVLESCKVAKERMAGDRAGAAAERVARYKERADSIKVSLLFKGKIAKTFHPSITITTDPIDPHLAGRMGQVDAAQILRVVEFLEKTGFFERAGGHLELRRDYPAYVLSVGGLEENLGWGEPMLKRLQALRAVMDGRAAELMDDILVTVKDIPAMERERAAAERMMRVVAGIQDFTLELDYSGPEEKENPAKRLTLSLAKAGATAPPHHLYAALSEGNVSLILDQLSRDGFFDEAAERANVEAGKPCYLLRVQAGGLRLEENLGWSEQLANRLSRLSTEFRDEGAIMAFRNFRESIGE